MSVRKKCVGCIGVILDVRCGVLLTVMSGTSVFVGEFVCCKMFADFAVFMCVKVCQCVVKSISFHADSSFLMWCRGKEDPYNSIMAGFFTGATLASRGGVRQN